MRDERFSSLRPSGFSFDPFRSGRVYFGGKAAATLTLFWLRPTGRIFYIFTIFSSQFSHLNLVCEKLNLRSQLRNVNTSSSSPPGASFPSTFHSKKSDSINSRVFF